MCTVHLAALGARSGAALGPRQPNIVKRGIMIDINYYLLRHTVAQRQADRSNHPKARAAHQKMADAYRRILDHAQSRRRAGFALISPDAKNAIRSRWSRAVSRFGERVGTIDRDEDLSAATKGGAVSNKPKPDPLSEIEKTQDQLREKESKQLVEKVQQLLEKVRSDRPD